MKNILMLFLGFLIITSVQTTSKDAFLNEVKNGYASYEILSDVNNDDYVLCVVRGINKNKASAGVYFYSICEGEYYCTINNGVEEYKFVNDKNKQVYFPAMSYTDPLEVKVYNCDDEFISSCEIKRINKATFVGTEGLNQGLSFTSPKNSIYLSKPLVLFYVCGLGVIALCAVIIVIFKINKKGMFDEEVRKEGIADFKAFEKEYHNEELHTDDEIILDEKEYIVEEETTEEVYTKIRDYEDDALQNVKQILDERGYNTNYSEMDVEEKNKVMVELMMLREQKIITNDSYQHEIIELWKK